MSSWTNALVQTAAGESDSVFGGLGSALKNRVFTEILGVYLIFSVGLIGSVFAVNVSSDGVGQVLIYPYYTTRDGQTSRFTVVNNSDDVRAVSIRFFEGKAARDVLDFNLYLAPHDVWIGTILDNGTGAAIKTTDLSCTVPDLSQGDVFRSVLYAGDAALDNSPDRTREGYVVTIEMAVVTGAHAEWATHVAGTPVNCGALINSWISGGDWQTTGGIVNTSPVTDGGTLSGRMTIVDPSAGVVQTYEAFALEAFNSVDNLHASPGGIFPSLNQAQPQSTVVRDGQLLSSTWSGAALGGVDAISAVITHKNIMNGWNVEVRSQEGKQHKSDWIFNFPTKRFYVPADGAPSAQPFSTNLTADGACEGVDLHLFDREESILGSETFNFLPIQASVPGPSLCWVTSVVTFGNTSALGSELSENIDISSASVIPAGWMEVYFDFDLPSPGVSEHPILTSDEGHEYIGLPVIPLRIQYYESLTVTDLIISAISLSNATPTEGQLFSINSTIKNQGIGTSASTTLRYYRSTDPIISTGDTFLGTDGVPGLALNETAPESISVSIATAGTYWVGSCVDAVSGEAIITNNCSRGAQVVVSAVQEPSVIFRDGFEGGPQMIL